VLGFVAFCGFLSGGTLLGSLSDKCTWERANAVVVHFEHAPNPNITRAGYRSVVRYSMVNNFTAVVEYRDVIIDEVLKSCKDMISQNSIVTAAVYYY